MPYENTSLHNPADYKHQALQAAKELRYPASVIRDVEKAKTDEEIRRIMKNARLKDWED